MNIIKDFLIPNKYSRPQTPLTKVTKVAVHYTGNPKSTAKNNRDYFNNLAQTHATYVSSHYIVGLQGEIIQCIPENEWSYCTNQANGYSISIEVCHPDTTGKFNDVTEQALVELVADICKRHKLNPQSDVIRHYDVTGKHCPLWYVNNPTAWQSFKNRVELAMKPIVEVKTETKQYYKLEVFSFKKKEDADAIKQALKLMKVYAETHPHTEGFYKVVSYSYETRERAAEVQQGLKLICNAYSEIKLM